MHLAVISFPKNTIRLLFWRLSNIGSLDSKIGKNMKTRIIQMLAASVCGALVAACGTVSKEHRTLLDEHTRTFTVQSIDKASNTPVTSRDIVNALVQSIYAESNIQPVHSFYSGNGRYTQGLSAEIDKSLNVTAYYRENYESLAKYKAGTFKVAMSNDGQSTKVQVTCPASIEDYDNYKGGISGRKLFPDNEVAADLSRICNGLKIEIKRQKYVKSELNTQFPSDSVFANFSRKLKASREPEKIKSYDIEKAKLFTLSQGKNSFDLAVSVFPYRSGSKVIYGFNYPYSVLGDGSSTFKLDDVRAIEKSIASIAND